MSQRFGYTLKKIRGLQRLRDVACILIAIPIEILGLFWYDVVLSNAETAKPENILNYYFHIQTEGQPLNEAKLIMVGFGAVGKTSLANRLINNTFDSES